MDSRWTVFSDVKAQLDRMWDSGKILTDSPFPLDIKITGPLARDLKDSLVRKDAVKWSLMLQEEAKKSNVKVIFSKKMNIPMRVIVPDVNTALKIMGKSREYSTYMKLTEMTKDRLPALLRYVQDKPLDVIKHADDWPHCINVCEWMLQNPMPGIYVREAGIQGVDSKFIENHKSFLSKLFDLILPSASIDSHGTCFEERYGFKRRENSLYIRFPLGMNRFATEIISLSKFAAAPIVCEEVIVVENKISFELVPRANGRLIIWGQGYASSLLSQVLWLRDKKIYYWGDIDTHGFRILSVFRKHFPQVQSLFMDRETLNDNKELCVQELKPVEAIPEHLTEEERQTFLQLRSMGNVRLEQERISNLVLFL